MIIVVEIAQVLHGELLEQNLDFETEIPDITRVCEKTKLDALFDQRDHTCTKVLLKTFDLLSTYLLTFCRKANESKVNKTAGKMYQNAKTFNFLVPNLQIV